MSTDLATEVGELRREVAELKSLVLSLGRNDSEQRFLQLAAEWKAASPASSSVKKLVSHPAYQRIVGMGPPALPLIFADLKKQPDHWFWALHAITGEDPVPREARGNLPMMAQAWLEWGRERGLVD